MPSSDSVSNPRRHLPLFMREAWPFAICLALLACLLYGFDANPFRGLDSRWGDMLLRLRFQLGLEPRPDPRVFIVGLDTGDLVGASTTEAEYHTYADLFDIMTALNVSSTSIDLILARGSEMDAHAVIEAIRKNGHVVLAEAQTPTMVERSFLFAPPSFPSGLINITSDSGGVHRRYSYGDTRGECKPSLALAAYLASFRPAKKAVCVDGDFVWKQLSADGVALVERKIPSKSVLLNFRSPYTQPWDRGFKYLKVADLRAKYDKWQAMGADPNQISGLGLPDRESIVLIGSVATGGGDSGPTPFGASEPLLVLHATALDDLLQRLPLKEAPPAGNLGFTVLGLFFITLAGRWSRDLPRLLLSCGAVILLMLIAGSLLLFKGNIMIAGVTPALFMAASVFGESGRRASLASFEKAQLRETLGRYFSPNVLKDVLKNPDWMQPREADLTVLLTDVRNFTTITERYGTQLMFDLLNDIFEVETKAVIESDGSMEHFVGDQFLAYWGAPQEQPDAADRALQSAEKIIYGLDKLHATLEPAIKELFGFGVAIHRGKALFGNKGARSRLDYGILGDIVNGAARIESLTKYYGVRQIVTREVIETSTRKPVSRFLDRIRVKGKANPLEMFEVLIAPTQERIANARRYEEAWKIYARGEFAEAFSLFDALKETDRPSQALANRCKELIAHPPAQWDGAYQMSEK